MKNLNHTHQSRIERYLNRAMTASERKEFEQDLQSDRTLADAYVTYSLSEKGAAMHQIEELRAVTKSIRQQSLALPEPSITFFDRLQFLLYGSTARWVMVAIGMAGSLALIWMLTMQNKPTIPVGQLIQQHIMAPECTSIAGKDDSSAPSDAEMKELYAASDFYCGVRSGGADSLRARANACGIAFCFAKYYLAHWQLKNGAYTEAQTNFALCLDNKSTLANNTFTDKIDRVQLNSILAGLGATNDRKKAAEQATNLSQQKDCSGDVKKHIKALLEAL